MFTTKAMKIFKRIPVDIGKCIYIFITIDLICINSERPNFRKDYRYEKAFDTFYKLHRTATEWSVARIRCEAEGTELMVPESLDEADAMSVLIAAILNKHDGVYLGIHDLYSETNFVTINGSVLHDSILDLLWEYKEPKYNGGHCVAMRRNGRIFVHNCSKPLPYICKINAKRISYWPDCDTFDHRWKPSPYGKCYIKHEEPQNWYDAYATCLAAGGHLVILTNRTEADYIRDLFKQLSEHRMPDSDFAFLGFSDLFQRHHYRTVHDERLQNAGYFDWDIKCAEPKVNGTRTEDRCGGIRRSGLLSTGMCHVPAIFFCEKTANNKTNRSGRKQTYSSRRKKGRKKNLEKTNS